MSTSAHRPEGRPNWRNPLHLLAFGLGSGAAPKGPGTAGSLAAIPLYLLMSASLSDLGYLLATALMFLIGIPLCGHVARDLALEDPAGIVWDEWVGLLVTLWLAPSGWGWLVAGFLLFRFFDILKPWPIRWLDQRIHGGLGIMLDDLAAGLFAFVILQGAVYLGV